MAGIVQRAIPHVVGNSAFEKHDILAYQRQMGTQLPQLNFFDVLPIDSHGA
ncbi:hypothetical protein D3C72_2552540 [compost metagenome]